MTKKLLLTAASAVAVLFAGAAQAGQFTSIEVGTKSVWDGTDKTPYVFASERVLLDSTNAYVGPAVAADAAGALDVNYRLTNPVVINANASGTYTVRFDVTNAKFLAPIADNLTAILLGANGLEEPTTAYAAPGAPGPVGAAAPWVAFLGVPLADATGAVITAGEITALTAAHTAFQDSKDRISATVVLNTEGALIGLVSVAAGITPIRLGGFDLDAGLTRLTGSSVDLTAETRVLQGGLDLKIDETSGARGNGIITFGALIDGLKATENDAVAALTDYVTFLSAPTPGTSWNLTSGVLVAANKQSDGTTDVVRYGAFDGTALTVAAILNGGELTVTSATGQVGALANIDNNGTDLARKAGAIAAGAVTFTVPNNSTIENTTGLTLHLENADDANGDVVVLEPGQYSISHKPTFVNNYAAASSSTFTVTDAGAITLEGTNFVAPWVALGEQAQGRPLLRIANGSSIDTGAIFLTLRSFSGAAPTNVKVPLTSALLSDGFAQLTSEGGIPAGGVIVIDGTKLGAAFGTNSANGDVQVTIQGDKAGLTAALRVRDRVTNTTFEQRLGQVTEQAITY